MKKIMSYLPGWESLDVVSSIHTGLEIAAIITLVLLVVADVFALIYSSREKALTKQAETTAQTQHAAQIGDLTGRLSEAQKKVTKLELQNTPRRLSEADKALLIQDLRHSPGQKARIMCLTVAWDCADYGNDFLEVFKQAKWEVSDTVFTSIMIGRDPVGLEVVVNPEVIANPKNVPGDFADSIIYLCRTAIRLGQMAGPDPTLTPDSSIPYGTVELRIGRIPPPK